MFYNILTISIPYPASEIPEKEIIELKLEINNN